VVDPWPWNILDFWLWKNDNWVKSEIAPNGKTSMIKWEPGNFDYAALHKTLLMYKLGIYAKKLQRTPVPQSLYSHFDHRLCSHWVTEVSYTNFVLIGSSFTDSNSRTQNWKTLDSQRHPPRHYIVTLRALGTTTANLVTKLVCFNFHDWFRLRKQPAIALIKYVSFRIRNFEFS